METKPVRDGHLAPSEDPLSKLIPRLPHPMQGVTLESHPNKRLAIPRRKIEQACDLCRKRKVKCDGRSPSCASCEGHQTECSFTQIIKKRKRQEKCVCPAPPMRSQTTEQQRRRSLDLMAERIERMECMLRQRGFLKDEHGKPQVTEEDLEEIIHDIGRDVISVPSLCGTGLDSTLQTGFTLTGNANMDPPPVPDKSKALGHVEKWLESLPLYAAGTPSPCVVFEALPGENG